MTSTKSTNIRATICVPTRNAGERIFGLLHGILSQRIHGEFEVIFVDSASTDYTAEIIHNAMENDKRIQFYKIDPKDFGHGKTRNYLVSLAKSEFVAFLTQDAIPVHTRWLESILLPMEKDQKVAGVTGKHLPYPDSSPLVKRDVIAGMTYREKCPHRKLIDDPERYKNDNKYRSLLYYFSNNNSALRKSIWKLYNFENVDYGEDQIWSRTVLEQGYAIGFSPSAQTYHSHDYSFWERYERYSIDRKFWGEIMAEKYPVSFGFYLRTFLEKFTNDMKYLRKNNKNLSFYEMYRHAISHNLSTQLSYYVNSFKR